MNRLTRRLTIAATTAALALTLTAPSAQAGPWCSWWMQCQTITNEGRVAMGVIWDWNAPSTYNGLVYPGATTRLGADADGYYIGPGWCAWETHWNLGHWDWKGQGRHWLNAAYTNFRVQPVPC